MTFLILFLGYFAGVLVAIGWMKLWDFVMNDDTEDYLIAVVWPLSLPIMILFIPPLFIFGMQKLLKWIFSPAKVRVESPPALRYTDEDMQEVEQYLQSEPETGEVDAHDSE